MRLVVTNLFGVPLQSGLLFLLVFIPNMTIPPALSPLPLSWEPVSLPCTHTSDALPLFLSFLKSGALLGSATSNIHSLHIALQQSTNQSIPTIKIYTGPLSSACLGTVMCSAICEHRHWSLPVACVCHLLACLYGQMQAEPPPPWSFGFVQVQIIPSAAALHHC